ncbi:hypothetical protein FA13DRAFT_932106 [Coprinellus micaceus]|uniref:Uncharacterized protein n=1 Tax=Coprinellus micaceus TaxID=71717 RepID=A0A4Y7SZS4_COPMI|nr:hypothetical protein FA13DRAFT_932106 [Coprinellus micaceus]
MRCARLLPRSLLAEVLIYGHETSDGGGRTCIGALTLSPHPFFQSHVLSGCCTDPVPCADPSGTSYLPVWAYIPPCSGCFSFLRAESIHTWGIFEHRALPGTTARLPALMGFLKEE